jgi:alpha-mannosidase
MECGPGGFACRNGCLQHFIARNRRKGAREPELRGVIGIGTGAHSDYDIAHADLLLAGASRSDANDDRPANSFVFGVNQSDNIKSIFIVAKTKYGFRTTDNSISLTLLRSSYDPDPYPEIGDHRMQFSVGLTDGTANRSLIESASVLSHPMSVMSVKPSKGTLPLIKSFIKYYDGGSAVISSIKMPENGLENSMIIRFYETEGVQTEAELYLFKKIKNAHYIDVNEKKQPQRKGITINDQKVFIKISPYSLASILIEF